MNGELKILREALMEDIDISALKDISQIPIGDGKPAPLRTLVFMNQARNPYLFKVGKTPVKIVFPQKYAHVGIEAGLAKIVGGKVG